MNQYHVQNIDLPISNSKKILIYCKHSCIFWKSLQNWILLRGLEKYEQRSEIRCKRLKSWQSHQKTTQCMCPGTADHEGTGRMPDGSRESDSGRCYCTSPRYLSASFMNQALFNTFLHHASVIDF